MVDLEIRRSIGRDELQRTKEEYYRLRKVLSKLYDSIEQARLAGDQTKIEKQWFKIKDIKKYLKKNQYFKEVVKPLREAKSKKSKKSKKHQVQSMDMAICVYLGIFKGAGDGLMNPNDELQRSQMASLAVRLQDAILGV